MLAAVMTAAAACSAGGKASETPAGIRSRYDEGAGEIIAEELEPFFAGKVATEQAAAFIQSRVEIYLSERS